jgi:predicted small metal-binding protein
METYYGLSIKQRKIINHKCKSIIYYYMKSLSCREIGFNCPSVIKGNTEGEVIQKTEEHVSSAHNIQPENMSPEMQHKIRGLIRTTSSLS